jgi:hypothetical protein
LNFEFLLHFPPFPSRKPARYPLSHAFMANDPSGGLFLTSSQSL